jgi:hypothetical protein
MKSKFERIAVVNNWKTPRRFRGSWVFLGGSIWWSGHKNYCYKLHFFGIDVHLWFVIS